MFWKGEATKGVRSLNGKSLA